MEMKSPGTFLPNPSEATQSTSHEAEQPNQTPDCKPMRNSRVAVLGSGGLEWCYAATDN